MWRHLASNVLTLSIVALVMGVGVLAWASRAYEAPGPLAEAICLQVAPGSNFTRVASDLEAQGAVSNGMLLRLGADYSDKAGSLKAGSFLIDEASSMSEIVDLVTGDGLSTCGTEVIYRISVNRQEKRVRELDAATQEFVVTAEFDPKADEAPSGF